MPEAGRMTPILELIESSRADALAAIETIERDLAERRDELARLDAAKAELEQLHQPARPAGTGPDANGSSAAARPGSPKPPRPATPPTPVVQKAHRGQGRSATAERVLEQLGGEWTAMGPLVEALGCSDFTVRDRLAILLERGDIEQKGERAGRRYRRVDAGRAADQPPESVVGKDEKACAPRPVDSSPSAEVSTAEPKPELTGPPPGDSFIDKRLVDQIEGVLRRASQPLSASDIAKSLVVSVANVATQLQIMVRKTEQGDRYPGIHRDAAGNYSLLVGAAA